MTPFTPSQRSAPVFSQRTVAMKGGHHAPVIRAGCTEKMANPTQGTPLNQGVTEGERTPPPERRTNASGYQVRGLMPPAREDEIMGREVRMAPPDWKHPKNEKGFFKPLLDGSFSERLAEWEEGKAQWNKGFRSDYSGGWKPKDKDMTYPYEEWDGECPVKESYMPDFAPGTATHFCMYEDVSEGTPISPVFETPEQLARWLADNGASAFGRMTATYEQWLPICRGGFAPSMVVSGGRIMSGVEAATES